MWERFKALCKFSFLLSWSYYLSDFRSGSITRNKLETAVGWTFQSSNLTFQNALLKFNCASSGCGPKTGPVQLSLCPHTQPVSVECPHQRGSSRHLRDTSGSCFSLTYRAAHWHKAEEAVAQLWLFVELFAATFSFQKSNNVTEPLRAAVSILVGQEIDFIFCSSSVWVKNCLFLN